MNPYKEKLEQRKNELTRRAAAYTEAADICSKLARATDVSEDVQAVFKLQRIELLDVAERAKVDLVKVEKMLGQAQINRHNEGVENLSIARVQQFQETGK